MALVESNRTCEDVIGMLRGALIDEISATDLYDQISAKVPESMRSTIEEIKKDELNHQGRLLNLIMELQPAQMEPFNKGLEQQE